MHYHNKTTCITNIILYCKINFNGLMNLLQNRKKDVIIMTPNYIISKSNYVYTVTLKILHSDNIYIYYLN